MAALLASLVLVASCASQGDPAGILLYSRHQGQIQLLVANDAPGVRGWSGFGGTARPGEGTKLTAARETSEETRGYFDQDWLLERIIGSGVVEINGFHLYFAEVPHVPAQEVMSHPVEPRQMALREFEFYTWVPFAEIKPLLSKAELTEADLKVNPRHLPHGCRADSYWRVWIAALQEAHRQQAFPWECDSH